MFILISYPSDRCDGQFHLNALNYFNASWQLIMSNIQVTHRPSFGQHHNHGISEVYAAASIFTSADKRFNCLVETESTQDCAITDRLRAVAQRRDAEPD